MHDRAFYSDTIDNFLTRSPTEILGRLTSGGGYAVETSQRDAWLEQIAILRPNLTAYRGRGKIYFEYTVPRLGKRIDVVLVIDHVIFVLEFKVGSTAFFGAALDQVWDYALDLKNFHSSTHDKAVVPILIATNAAVEAIQLSETLQGDGVLHPIKSSVFQLIEIFARCLQFCDGNLVDIEQWDAGRYLPTPTIVEAAMALYAGHAVEDISRSDAGATNLRVTSMAISQVIEESRAASRKSICFITGVPGAGKTLVGLDIATKHTDKDSELYSVFLSGNGPLVSILREALARDHVSREAEAGRKLTKGEARRKVQLFIQNVHHFRDACLQDESPPPEHVAIFDEAQRAWNLEMTADFMQRKKDTPNFKQSEPEFLVSCMDRHASWAVVVCLVGGGQEINRGEAGITEWIRSLCESFPDWNIHISSRLQDDEYGAGLAIEQVKKHSRVTFNNSFHLGISMRSFRAENVSRLVKHLLDCNAEQAQEIFAKVRARYPIVISRNVKRAKAWLKDQARGSERYGMVASSQAQRLKPHAIDVRTKIDPIHWFLDRKEDVRSSYYLEDVATEFDVQGLELDWACVVWDGDFRYSAAGWMHFSFVGSTWNRVLKAERQAYLKNAYRVLLTRARQGMAIVVPEGDHEDPTRKPLYYDATFNYLASIGFTVI